jgi:hypothetical protein
MTNPFSDLQRRIPHLTGGSIAVSPLGSKVDVSVLVVTDQSHRVSGFCRLIGCSPSILTTPQALGWYLSCIGMLLPQCFREITPLLTMLGYRVVPFDESTLNLMSWPLELPTPNLQSEREVLTSEAGFAVIIGLLMQLIHKQISDKNYQGWLENRLRALNQKLNTAVELTIDTFIPEEILASLCNLLQSTYELRRKLFECFVAISNSTNVFGIAATHSLELMRFTNMSYLVTINTVLVEPAHPILYWSRLAGEVKKLAIAYKHLADLGGLAPYVKILFKDSELSYLNRNNFPMLASAAKAIGVKTIPSLQYLVVSAPQDVVNSISEKALLVDELWRGETTTAEDIDSYTTLALPGMTNAIKTIINTTATPVQLGAPLRVANRQPNANANNNPAAPPPVAPP